MQLSVVFLLAACIGCCAAKYVCNGTKWILHGSYCYYRLQLSRSTPRNMNLLKNDICRKYDSLSRIASVHSKYEASVLRTAKLRHSFIGLHIPLQYASLKKSLFRWSDGTKVDYQDWAPKQPDNGAGGERFVMVRKNSQGIGWHDYPVSAINAFVCKKKAVKVTPPRATTPASGSTPASTTADPEEEEKDEEKEEIVEQESSVDTEKPGVSTSLAQTETTTKQSDVPKTSATVAPSTTAGSTQPTTAAPATSAAPTTTGSVAPSATTKFDPNGLVILSGEARA